MHAAGVRSSPKCACIEAGGAVDTQKPDQRKDYIMRAMDKFAQLDRDPTCKAFGMQVNKNMVEVWTLNSQFLALYLLLHCTCYCKKVAYLNYPFCKTCNINKSVQVDARVLPPPKLIYSSLVDPGPGGSWDLRKVKFMRPAKLLAYGIASFADRRRCGRGAEDPGSLQVQKCLSMKETGAAMIAPCICARGVAANELEDVPLVGQACYFDMLTLPVFVCGFLMIQETAVQCSAWSDMTVVLMECKVFKKLKNTAFDPELGAQAFMYDLLNMLRTVGIGIPSNEALPEIIWHDPQRFFPGDTLKAAVDAGAGHFGAPPGIIFVCLPDTGARAA